MKAGVDPKENTDKDTFVTEVTEVNKLTESQEIVNKISINN